MSTTNRINEMAADSAAKQRAFDIQKQYQKDFKNTCANLERGYSQIEALERAPEGQYTLDQIKVLRKRYNHLIKQNIERLSAFINLKSAANTAAEIRANKIEVIEPQMLASV